MLKKLFYSSLFVAFFGHLALAQTTYYLQGALPNSYNSMDVLSNWNTDPAGTGTNPANFNNTGDSWDMNGRYGNLLSNLTIAGTITNSGVTPAIIDVNGKDFVIQGAATVNQIVVEDQIGGGSVEYSGTFATDILSGTYTDLLFSGSGTFTATGNITISGNLSTSGPFGIFMDMNAHNLIDGGSFAIGPLGSDTLTIHTQSDSLHPIPSSNWPAGTKIVFDDAASIVPQHIPSGNYDALKLTDNIKQIAAGDTVTIHNKFKNHTTLILQADSTGYAQLKTMVDMETTPGDVLQKQYFLEPDSARYYHRGTALNGADLKDFNNGQTMNFANNGTGSVWKWDASTSEWVMPDSTNNNATEAYAMYAGTNGFGSFLITGSVGVVDVESDDVHYNDVNATLEYHDGIGSSVTFVDAIIDGWNFVANPFLANYDFEGHNTAGSIAGSMANYYYVLNGDKYSFYQKGGLTNGTGGTATNGVSAPRYIAPGQGVWFRTNATWSGTTTFAAANQKVSGTSQMFKTTGTTDLLRVDVTEVNGSNSDQVLIKFDQNASDAEDFSMDVPKKSNTGNVPNTFIKLGNATYALCVTSPSRKSFPLHFRDINHGQQMEYSISENSLTSYHTVFIEDKKNNTFTEITNANYTFVNDTAFGADRFVLHFEKGVGLPEGMLPDAANFDAYYANGEIKFIFQEEGFTPTSGGLYTLQGKLINQFEVNEARATISTPNLPTGIYLLAMDNDVSGARKLYINK